MTDPFTGYRYYREDQFITMGRICSLKEMGFSLSDIASITGEPMNRNVQKRFSQKLNKMDWDGSAAEKYFQETLFENPE